MSDFSHININTNQPEMVDVSDKAITKRTATAQSIVVVTDEIMRQFAGGEIHTKKGPVFQTAIIAGSMAAKKNSRSDTALPPAWAGKCEG